MEKGEVYDAYERLYHQFGNLCVELRNIEDYADSEEYDTERFCYKVGFVVGSARVLLDRVQEDAVGVIHARWDEELKPAEMAIDEIAEKVEARMREDEE